MLASRHRISMRYAAFLIFSYLLAVSAYAGPDDKWVPASSSGWSFDGIALIIAISAFVWAYVIYKDHMRHRKSGRR